jgi:hypothetical protein
MTGPLPPVSPIQVDKNIAVSTFRQIDRVSKTDFGSEKTDSEIVFAEKARASAALDRELSSLDPAVRQAIVQNGFSSTSSSFVAGSGPITQQQIRDINAKPNVLDNFANYTYHIVFSIIKEPQAYTVVPSTDLNSVDRIIIAESGATVGYNITNFTINNSVSPGFKHNSQSVTEWKMTLTEPYGLTFPDYMLLAAKEMEIKNSAKFPYFIELWFTGYDENGAIAEPKVTRKIWRVLMMDFDVTTNETGTVYNISGIVDNDTGSSNQFSIPPAALSLNGVKTFGDAMDTLKKTLNDAAKKAENKDISATEYDIVLPPSVDMRSWKIDDALENDQRQGDFKSDGYSISITRGQDIGLFIMSVLSKCGSSAEAFLRGTAGSGTAPSIESNGLGRVIKIFTEVKYGKYNETLNDYQRIITYRLIPFTTPRTVGNPDDARRMSQIGVQQSKLEYLTKNNLLAKKYEYLYTGKNTDVIKFDVHVENFWAITLPTFLASRTYSQATNGAVVANNSPYHREGLGYTEIYKTNDEVTARASNPDSVVSNPNSGELSPSSFAQLKSSFTSINPSIANLASGVALLNQTVGQAISAAGKPTNLSNMSSLVESINKLTRSVAGSELTKSLKEFSNLSTLNVTPIPTFDSIVPEPVQNLINNIQTVATGAFEKIGSAFGSPVSASSNIADARRTRYLEDIRTKLTQDDPQIVSFMIDSEPRFQNSVNNGVESKNKINSNSAFTVGQSMWAQTIGNLYDPTFMLEIEIEIRGDPWWLGMTNIEENEFSKTLATVNDKANYLVGENMFLLTFKTPSQYNEQTGLMDYNLNNDYFNGIYSVLEVENRFENGAFVQRLKAYKELFSQKINKELTGNPETTKPASAQTPATSSDATSDAGISVWNSI